MCYFKVRINDLPLGNWNGGQYVWLLDYKCVSSVRDINWMNGQSVHLIKSLQQVRVKHLAKCPQELTMCHLYKCQPRLGEVHT